MFVRDSRFSSHFSKSESCILREIFKKEVEKTINKKCSNFWQKSMKKVTYRSHDSIYTRASSLFFIFMITFYINGEYNSIGIGAFLGVGRIKLVAVENILKQSNFLFSLNTFFQCDSLPCQFFFLCVLSTCDMSKKWIYYPISWVNYWTSIKHTRKSLNSKHQFYFVGWLSIKVFRTFAFYMGSEATLNTFRGHMVNTQTHLHTFITQNCKVFPLVLSFPFKYEIKVFSKLHILYTYINVYFNFFPCTFIYQIQFKLTVLMVIFSFHKINHLNK